MEDKYIHDIAEQANIKLKRYKSVGGGSISSAYMLEDESTRYFLKINRDIDAIRMFDAERKGLKTIRDTNTIAVPEVHLTGSSGNYSFIIMDFIDQKTPESNDYVSLGTRLAKMHQISQSEFGFESSNFIGSLHQSNNQYKEWSEFYWFERILPQLILAVNNQHFGVEILKKENNAIRLIDDIFGKKTPSLVHGDLWSGNYLIAIDGTPYIIDPAVYYGDPMADIAMSKLFGGFATVFYDVYHHVIPKSYNYNSQIELHQLYYLLVHLNLFGSGYYMPVSNIIRKYF